MDKHPNKKFLSIFIPITSVISVSAIVVPMVCLITQKTYLTRETADRKHFVKLEDTNDIKFTFTLTNANDNIHNLSCSGGYTISSLRNCAVKLNNIEGVDNDTFILHLSLIATNENVIKLGDSISFDLHFVYKNNDEVVGKQDMRSNYIKVTDEENG